MIWEKLKLPDFMKATNWWEVSVDDFTLSIAEYKVPYHYFVAGIFYTGDPNPLWREVCSTFDIAKNRAEAAIEYARIKHVVRKKIKDGPNRT